MHVIPYTRDLLLINYLKLSYVSLLQGLDPYFHLIIFLFCMHAISYTRDLLLINYLKLLYVQKKIFFFTFLKARSIFTWYQCLG